VGCFRQRNEKNNILPKYSAEAGYVELGTLFCVLWVLDSKFSTPNRTAIRSAVFYSKLREAL